MHDRKYTIQCGKCGKSKIVGYKYLREVFPVKATTTHKKSGWCVGCKNTKPNSGSFTKGQKAWNWKGGITPENIRIRSSVEYKKWRRAVFVRDRFTCQICGQIGRKLEADHIKPFAHFPDLRLELSNGRTLCIICHATTPSYKGRANRKTASRMTP